MLKYLFMCFLISVLWKHDEIRISKIFILCLYLDLY
jgi:hypothetical protein